MPSERILPPIALGPLLPPPPVGWPRQQGKAIPLKIVCRMVRQVVAEMVSLFGDRVLLRCDRRRLTCHIRQIAMYVCHVALRITQSDIGDAFGRDRTTVRHACHVVEDRRDDPAFDDFVSAAERIVVAIFSTLEVEGDEG